MEEVRGLIDKIDYQVEEVKKMHSTILSAPNPGDSKSSHSVQRCVSLGQWSLKNTRVAEVKGSCSPFTKHDKIQLYFYGVFYVLGQVQEFHRLRKSAAVESGDTPADTSV